MQKGQDTSIDICILISFNNLLGTSLSSCVIKDSNIPELIAVFGFQAKIFASSKSFFTFLLAIHIGNLKKMVSFLEG